MEKEGGHGNCKKTQECRAAREKKGVKKPFLGVKLRNKVDRLVDWRETTQVGEGSGWERHLSCYKIQSTLIKISISLLSFYFLK